MDEELRSYLNGALSSMEKKLTGHVNEALSSMESRFNERLNRAVEATAAEIGALHTDIREVEERLTAKMDEYHSRLDRHAGMLQTGARQLTRTFRDEEALARQWRALAKRVDALEART